MPRSAPITAALVGPFVALALSACGPSPAPAAPSPAPPASGSAPPAAGSPAKPGAATVPPGDLKALEAAHDWQYDPGEALNTAWNDGVQAILGERMRADALAAAKDAGFECAFGEATESYKEPAAKCTRSFATRSCQMDWEIFLTNDQATHRIETLSGSYRRDCVGIDRDWPVPVKSAIDDQLAPPPPLKP